MNQEKEKKFTRYVTLGWWLGFVFFVSQATIITVFNLCATPLVGLSAFLSFVILSFSPHYNKEYEFSPYRGFIKLFNKKNKKKGK